MAKSDSKPVEAQPSCRKLVADLQREFPGDEHPLSHYLLTPWPPAWTMRRSSPPMWVSIRCGPPGLPAQPSAPDLWRPPGTMGFHACCRGRGAGVRSAICFSGDGSLMMNIQEMATAAENQCQNHSDEQRGAGAGTPAADSAGVFAATYPGMINFMQIAAGFGLQTCDLNAEEDAHAALQAAISRPGPALIHVRIDPEQKVYPMVPPGAANTEMVGE